MRTPKLTLTLLSAALITIILSSCESDPYADIEPTPVGELEYYENSSYKYKIKLPKEWNKETAPTRVTAYSFATPEAKRRFKDYSYNGYPIAKIDLIVAKLDSTRSFEDVFNDFRRGWQDTVPYDSSAVYSPTKNITIDGVPGKTFTYQNPQNDGHFQGKVFMAQGDSATATVLVIEAFADAMEEYEPAIEEIVSTLRLAQTPPEVGDTLFVAGEELPPPSDTLTSMSGDGFTIQVPKNFKKSQRGQGIMFDGERRGDSYIMIETTKATVGSSKAAAEKQNETIKGTVKSTKINGETVYYIEYSPTQSIKRRLYFVLKNNKIYRITMDWSKDEEDLYLPIFEKSVSTFKVK